jgi:hypothetical protein
VRHLHVAAAQRAHQLVLVIPRDAQRVPRGDHPHDQAQHAGGVRSAVDEVADGDRATALGVDGVHGAAVLFPAQQPRSMTRSMGPGPGLPVQDVKQLVHHPHGIVRRGGLGSRQWMAVHCG